MLSVNEINLSDICSRSLVIKITQTGIQMAEYEQKATTISTFENIFGYISERNDICFCITFVFNLKLISVHIDMGVIG